MYRHDTFLAEWQLGWEGGRTGVVGLQGSQRGVPEMGMHHLGADIVAICCLGRPEDLHNGGTSVARHRTQQIIIPTASTQYQISNYSNTNKHLYLTSRYYEI